jgi:hypothetical protein
MFLFIFNIDFGFTNLAGPGAVVETVRTVKNILDYWRIESIILFLYVNLEKPMIASIAHVRDVIGML